MEIRELGLNKTRKSLTTDYLVSLSAGMSSQMCLPGGNNIGGLSRDDGTVGVGDKSVVEVGIGHGSHRVDSTSSSSMGSPGSNHVRGVGRDNSAVGMADQGSGSIDNRSMGNASNGVDGAASVVEGSLGSGDGRGVGGNHGAVGVTNQLGGGDRHAGRENLETIFVWSKCKSGILWNGLRFTINHFKN